MFNSINSRDMGKANKISPWFLISLFITSLVACGGGSYSSSTNSNISPTPDIPKTDILTEPVIYLPTEPPNATTILVYNNTANVLKLKSAQFNNQAIYPQQLSSSLNNPTVIINDCITVTAGGTCPININDNSDTTNNIQLSLSFINPNNNNYILNQSIIYTNNNYSYTNTNNESFTILGTTTNSISTYIAPNTLKQFTMSFVLTKNYSNSTTFSLITNNTNVTPLTTICPSYTKGSVCSANLLLNNTKNQIGNNGQQVEINFTITSNGASNANSNRLSLANSIPTKTNALTLTVNVSNQPNLIINPSNVTIESADGNHHKLIIITNSGNESAIIGQITAGTPLTLESNTNSTK